MTRELVTQLVEVLESTTYNGPKMGRAITAAREYLATEPSGERAELIAQLRDAHGRRFDTSPSPYSRAADMLEADAQQAKRMPMTFEEVENCFPEGATSDSGYVQVSAQWTHDFARAIEAHHGITE